MRAAKGLGEANREYVGLRGKVVWGRGRGGVEEGERIKKHRWSWRVGAVFCPRGGSMGSSKPGGNVGNTGY